MGRLAKFRKLPNSDKLLLVAVFALVAVTRAALTVTPFRHLRNIIDRINLRTRPIHSQTPERLIWAVKAVSQFVPGATCLTQALAAEILYATRGDLARTCYGVARNAVGNLEAHAWLEAGGKVVLGAVETGKFTPLVRC